MVQIKEKKFEIYITEKEIQRRIKFMAEEIDGKKLSQALMVSVLNGASFFTIDLMKALKTDIELAFIRVSSYQGTQSSGELDVKLWFDQPIKGRSLLIVEDIVDTGFTLNQLIERFKKEGAREVIVISLLDKKEARKYPVQIDYLGFDIPEKFVVGYGLDYDGYGRGLRDIYQLKED